MTMTMTNDPKPTRIVIENVYESRAEPNEAAHMSLLFFTSRPFWPRASKMAASCFNSLAQGGSRTRHVHDKEVLSNSEVWFAKVVCTLFLRSNSEEACFGYLSNNLSPSIALEVIRRLNNPKLGLKFFELSRDNLSLVHSPRTYDYLMRSLCRMGLHDSARFVLDCMRSDGHSPDCSVIEVLVSSYVQVGKLDLGENLLDELKCDKVKLTPFVYNSLLNELIKRNQVSEAVWLVRKHVGSHFRPDVWTFNILIRGLCGFGDIRTAFEVLGDMEKCGCSADNVTYNTLIHGLCRANEVDTGRNLLKKLKAKSSFFLDVRAFTSVISGYCKLGRMEDASALFVEMVQSGIRPNEFTFNTLIDGFCKSHNMASAMALFKKMALYSCRPDVITFTSLIDGHCRVGEPNQALNLWHEMRSSKVSPNGHTFSVLILALCRSNRLSDARDLLRQLNLSNVVVSPFVYNPVIDGFCKAGNIDEANVIVAEMEAKRCNPDKITFTMLVTGNCMKGRMSEAIGIFNKMVERGFVPDEHIVRNLITDLNKAGMPNESRHIRKIATKYRTLTVSCSRSIHHKEDAGVPVAPV